MFQTTRLGLPYILTGQSQKEVTHNEALNRLDAFITPVVIDIVDTPPSSPDNGDIYIVGTSATGAFTGHSNKVAQYITGSWEFYPPFKWMDAIVESLQSRLFFDGVNWQPWGLIMRDSGEYLRIGHWQEDISLGGSAVDSISGIPDRSLVIAINSRVIEEITGATSFSVGVSGDETRYGNGIGIIEDSTNIGMSYHPISYYANTPIKITANGGSFTGGIVRISAQYLKPNGPWNW